MKNLKTHPTIENQGYHVLDITNTKLLSKTTFKNGAIEKISDDEYIYITGNIPYSDNDTKLEICRLDKNFNILNKGKILDLEKTVSNDIVGDARLIYHDGLIYCAYTELYNHKQRLCIMNKEFKIVKNIYINYGNNYKCDNHYEWSGCGKHEKNWNFFFHNNKLYFIYSIRNHIVVEIDMNGNIIKEYRLDMEMPPIYNYFSMHSGTPPKLFDDNHYITFFHTWHNSEEWVKGSFNRQYSISAYLFENKPPFHIKKMTKPLIYGSPYNTKKNQEKLIYMDASNSLIKNKSASDSNAKVVFATGNIFDNDTMLVSMGLNDIDTKIIKITKQNIYDNYIDYNFMLPKIEEMGYETISISNTDKLQRHGFKNGSIEKINDNEYVYAVGSYIHSLRNDGKLELCKLDNKFSIIKNKTINLPKTDSEDNIEDPRLIYHDGLIYCAYTESYNHNQLLSVFDKNLDFIKQISIKYGNNHTCHQIHKTWSGGCNKWEKNWNFFFNDNKLYFIYSIIDHVVVEIDINGNVINDYIMELYRPPMYEYFSMHSGTPPKLFDDNHYITFFHSWDQRKNPNHSHNRSYSISAYLFENKPPFHIKKMTKPLIYGSPHNTKKEPMDFLYADNGNVNYFGCSQVVFATGVVFEKDYMLVSMGFNDVETKLVKITRDDINNNLIEWDIVTSMKTKHKYNNFDKFKHIIKNK